jgi:DNA-binding NtrC family response regulator
MNEAHCAPVAFDDAPVPTILVVEDDVLVRTVAAAFLRESKFEVVEAGSAEEAMCVLGAGIGIDLVFSDVNMSGEVDGFQLAAWINVHVPMTKVILTTGALCTQEQSDALATHLVIAKPYDYDTLARRIRETLGR